MMTCSAVHGRALVRVGSVAATLVTVLAWSSGAPRASHVNCGDLLIQDVKLDSDLTDCAGSGLVIGADNITVDLNGHTVDGVGSGNGIDNSGGYDRVTIKNGTVREFAVGVGLSGANDNRMSQLAVTDNGAGIDLNDSDRNVIERSITSFSSSVFGAGIFLLNDSDQNLVSKNDVLNNPLYGILVDDRSDNNVIEKNHVRNTQFGGGIVLDDANHNRVENNDVSGNGSLGGIVVSGSGNVVSRNELTANFDGIRVFSGAADTLVERNFAHENTDDGIDVDSVLTTITRNTANSNGDLGIEAPDFVTDGGGNKASGNGNPFEQCSPGVSCS